MNRFFFTSRRRRLIMSLGSAMLLLGGGSTATGQISGPNFAQIAQAERGFFTEQNRDAGWFFEQHSKVAKAIDAVKPGTKGIVEAFVVGAGIDADPVFGREASETAKVLQERFGAHSRTILISAGNAAGKSAAAHGSPANLWAVLAGVASRMNREEDVLILYTTSHGGPKVGLVYKDGDNGFGMIAPNHMSKMLGGLGIRRKLVMISACYSGEFVPALLNDDSVIITAASATTTSFGCNPGNDWTFFGDALINNSMREALPLVATKNAAFRKISEWELSNGLTPSEPQYYAGANTATWLTDLESRMPKTRSKPVGTPAVAVLQQPAPARKP